MDLAGRFSMVASVAVMAVAVHLVARIWHPQRLFLFDVGRDLTDRDRARIQEET